MRIRQGFPSVLFLIVLLSGCSGEPQSGAKEVKWDRNMCERCRMVLSDRVHSAQIRIFPKDKKRSKVLWFDDIGCVALWLEGKPWQDDPKTELWVQDHRNGQWIDARSATYVKGHQTPMEYGLGAQSDEVAGGFDYEQAKVHIFDIEQRFNLQQKKLKERLLEQARAREAEHQHNQHAEESAE
ncbi:MAG: hypothetical protein GY696_39065 [Gammaproteobacteria bacterium]|nr:hypothetical protein [Gammaproteobacteria bacterium]